MWARTLTAMLVAVGSLAWMPSGAVLAEQRVAMVIGNAAYEHTTQLLNPRNDARDMARALRELDFKVIEGLDLDKAAFANKLREFANTARGAETVMFFYAGHGLQVEGENYLVPIDSKLVDEVDLRLEAFELDAFLSQMRGTTNLVFLDACRNNPLAQNLARSMGTSRSTSIGRGLGRIESASGTLIAYATQPGNVAEDGQGRNSPFTKAILERLATPGMSVNDLLTSVTDLVMTRTGGQQQPWTHSSLRRPFYFKPSESQPPTAVFPSVSLAPPSAESKPISDQLMVEQLAIKRLAAQQEQLFWESVIDSDNVADIHAYLKQYPGGVFEVLARNRIEQSVSSAKVSSTAPTQEGPSVSSPSPPSLKPAESALGLERPKRRQIQKALAALGFDAGPADGSFGPKARAAISLWQEMNGYEATGRLTQDQADKLFMVSKEMQPKLLASKVVEEKKTQQNPDERMSYNIFRDCDQCPEMVVVPAGSFMMGSPSSEERRSGDETPQHRVTISIPFAVGKYEVTVGEYKKFTEATGRGDGASCRIWNGSKWTLDASKNWHQPGFSQLDSHPVTCVSWEDAKSYADWLSRKTGEQYRLLSESEWEYVARAKTSEPFHFGQTISSDQANYDAKHTYGMGRKGVYRQQTVAVGAFSANAFQLHDVHGNVWEWVEDCWHDSYVGAPSVGSAWTWGGNCARRVIRGGTWNGKPWALRSANRARRAVDNRDHNLGFRVARTLLHNFTQSHD